MMLAVWQAVFWVSLAAALYPYVIYPVVLLVVNRISGRVQPQADAGFRPTISVICPAYNQEAGIARRVHNILASDYPCDRIQVLIVGDGCTDRTLEHASRAGAGRVETVELRERQGKAAALNAGLERARGDVVVFTDAGIVTEAGTLSALVSRLSSPEVGCVSGEDRVEGSSGEGLYGRFELMLRREEAKLHSIAGASGCLYAMRRSLCRVFPPGMAPDFLSVLDTVRAGYRAVAEPGASGTMTATSGHLAEFERKTRTMLRGMTALSANTGLLNPARFPAFSFIIWSHKLMRWLAPLALAGILGSSFALRDVAGFGAAWILSCVAGSLAVFGLAAPGAAKRFAILRACAFFLLVNAAAARALVLWLAGVRQEVWEPTRRPS